MNKRKTILIRTYLVYFICLAIAIAIIFKLINIQYIDRDKYLTADKKATVRWANIKAPRGSIYSADEKLIATSVPIYDIRIDLGSQLNRKTNKVDTVIQKDTLNKYVYALADSLSVMARTKKIRPYAKPASQFASEILREYNKQNRYFLLLSNLTYPELMQIRTFPLFRKGAWGGLVVEEKEKRERPFGNLAYRTVGKFDLEKNEFTGLEAYYFKELEGKTGKRQEIKIAGNTWRPASNEDLVEPEKGNDLICTIDMRLQDVAENALRRCLDSNDASYGCAVLMEVSTGYVNAIANLKRISDGSYIEDYNYAIWDASEPGSTFKLASVMAILEEGTLDTNSIVPTGIKNFGAYKMEDSHVKFANVSLTKAFEESSNVGIAEATNSVFQKKPYDYVKFLSSLNLGKTLGLELQGERPSKIKNKDSTFVWSGTLPLMSIGYGVHVTPMQLLTLYNAVANNGCMVKPLFAKEIRNGGVVVKTMQPVVINKSICSEKTLGKLRAMMEGVVQHGTARSLRKSPFPIAGKTGTAQLNYAVKDSNGMGYRASFVGYFPADNPKYSCIVVVVNPRKGRYYGGELAAPVFKEIADKVYALNYSIQQNKQVVHNDTIKPFVRAGNAASINQVYSYLKLPAVTAGPSQNWVSFVSDSLYYKPININKNTLPNVVGMTAKDAVLLLERMGIKTIISGKGKIISTIPASGTALAKGQTVILNLGM